MRNERMLVVLCGVLLLAALLAMVLASDTTLALQGGLSRLQADDVASGVGSTFDISPLPTPEPYYLPAVFRAFSP